MDELDDLMYVETLRCLSDLNTSSPEYDDIDGRTLIEYCSESMSDVSNYFNHGYSIETAYKLAGKIIDQYQIVADLGLSQYDVSSHLYSSMLAIRRQDREVTFNSWVDGWTARCEDESMTDSDTMTVEEEDDLNDLSLDTLYL